MTMGYFDKKACNSVFIWGRVMAQQLRACFAFAEDQEIVCSIYMVTQNYLRFYLQET